jgi:hypothetical protein
LRDIHFLYRISLEPYEVFRELNPSMPELWYDQNATPSFGLNQVDPRGNVAHLSIVLGDSGIKYSTTIVPSPANITKFVQPSSSTKTTEEDILHQEDLPNFDNAFSPEESECFLSYLTARHIAPPLVLRFFSGDRIGQLLNKKLQSIVESVLFEPLDYDGNEGSNVKNINTHPWSDDIYNDNNVALPRVPACNPIELGTRHGIAMAEAEHTPNALLEPLLDVCRSAADKCIGDYRSSFVDLLCFVIRLATRFADMCRYHGTNTSLLKELHSFMINTASPLLTMWALEAFRAKNVAKEIQLHAHLALIHSPIANNRNSGGNDDNANISVDTVRSFLMSSSYVVTWHSKTEASESVLDGEIDGKKEKLFSDAGDMLFTMLTRGGGGGGGGGGGEIIEEIKSHDTPTRKVFDLIEQGRSLLVQWFLVDAEPSTLDNVLENIVNVGLHRESLPPLNVTGTNVQQVDLTDTKQEEEEKTDDDKKSDIEKNCGLLLDEWHGWQAVNQKPLCCTQMIESLHPYLPSTDSYQAVQFPGATKVSIFFDPKCVTEQDRDYVTIYKDETFTEFWGKAKKISGQAGWPGSGGRPPLVIPSDKFVVHFHSDQSNQDWGFRLEAKAPVSNEKAREMVEKENNTTTTTTSKLGLYACQRALAESMNDIELATKYLNNHRNELINEEKQLEEEKKSLMEGSSEQDESSSSSRGLYQDPVGGIVVNIQTSEIYLRDRMLMPVPTQMATHPHFLDVFGRNAEPFCAVVSSTEHRKWIQITHNDQEYHIKGWCGLRRTTGEGGRGAVASSVDNNSDSTNNDIRMQAYNLPIVEGSVGQSKVKWRTKDYLRYDRGTKGWISDIYDYALDLFVNSCTEKGASVAWPEVYYCDEVENHEGRCGSMLAFVEAEGDYEACKGHPGTWYDIRVVSPSSLSTTSDGRVEVYTLVEHGRLMQRTLAWTSNSKLSLYHLDIDGKERKSPDPISTINSAGNIFDGHYTEAPSGKLLSRAGAGARYNEDVYSLTVSRSRSYHGWTYENSIRPDLDTFNENETEEFVPKTFLYGLVPEALLDKYKFWKTGRNTLRGYLTNNNGKEMFFESKSILVLLHDINEKVSIRQSSTGNDDTLEETSKEEKIDSMNDTSKNNVVATIMRLKRGGEREFTLMNMDPSSVLNPSNGGGGGGLKQVSTINHFSRGLSTLNRLKNTLTRVDNMSHILLWTSSNASITEYSEITRIEMTRLNAQFELKNGSLFSLDHDGLKVSENPAKHVKHHIKNLPRSLILENRNGEPFIMVPNYRLTPIKISSAPFTTQVTTGRRPNSWSNHVQTRFYMYPIHPSGSYIQTESLASALYLVLVHMFNREYQKAAPLIATCHTDMKFSKEERWIMKMFKRDEKDQDKHPDAHACRLMLVLVCLECGESTKDIFDIEDDYRGYIKKNAHVSQACRLTIEDEQLLLTIISDQQRRLYLSCVDRRKKLDDTSKSSKS